MRSFRSLLAVALVGGATAASAQSINIDFSDFLIPSGAAAAGSAGDVWNGLPFNVAANDEVFAGFVDAQGNALPDVELEFSAAPGGDAYTTWPGTGGLAGSDLFESYRGFGTSIAASITFTLRGLTAPSYDVYVYAQGEDLTNGTTTVGIGAELQDINLDNTATDYAEGINYVVFRGVVAVNGEVDVTLLSEDNWVTSNGVQFIAIPEPSTYALLAGVAGLAFVLLRTRRPQS